MNGILRAISAAILVASAPALAQTPPTPTASPASADSQALALPVVPVVSTPPDYPRGKVSGYMYVDWYDNLSGDPSHHYNAAGADSGQVNIDGAKPITRDLDGVQIRRVYFQLDNDITARFATRFRLEADGKSLTSDGKLGVNVKAAYVLARSVVPRTDVYAGLVTTPLFEGSEGYWGYRSVEKTIADFRGVAPSADEGLLVKGFVDPDRRFGVTLFVGDGNGQKPETNRQKRSAIALPVRWRDLRLEPYADYENVRGHQDRATYKLFAGYDLPWHTALGWETVEQVQHVATGPTKQLLGHSLFVRSTPRPELSGFVRVDFWDPDRHAAKVVKQTLWIGGLDWQPVKDVHVIPNVEAMQYTARGGAVVPAFHDLQARLTFYYVFSKPQS